MNDAHQAAQAAGVVMGGGKAAAGITAFKYSVLGLVIGTISCVSVIMAATAPRGNRNLFICIMSTAMASLCGGNYVASRYGFVDDIVNAALIGDTTALSVAVTTLIGIAFICGLPAWGLMGGVFVWFERMRGKTIVEMFEDAKRLWK